MRRNLGVLLVEEIVFDIFQIQGFVSPLVLCIVIPSPLPSIFYEFRLFRLPAHFVRPPQLTLPLTLSLPLRAPDTDPSLGVDRQFVIARVLGLQTFQYGVGSAPQIAQIARHRHNAMQRQQATGYWVHFTFTFTYRYVFSTLRFFFFILTDSDSVSVVDGR